jgi:hypothetical protein
LNKTILCSPEARIIWFYSTRSINLVLNYTHSISSIFLFEILHVFTSQQRSTTLTWIFYRIVSLCKLEKFLLGILAHLSQSDMVSFFDRFPSGVRPSAFRNVPLVVNFKNYSKYLIPCRNLVAMATERKNFKIFF